MSSKSVAKIAKRVIMSTAESKVFHKNAGKIELNHNNVASYNLVQASTLPSQGDGDMERIGDEINTTGFKIRLLIGQKNDRPNVNFKVWVVTAPKGVGYSYANFFRNVTGNVLLDSINTDYCTVLYSDTFKPYDGALTAPGGVVREMTFTKQIWVPYKRVMKFGPADGATTMTNFPEIYFLIAPYDAYGTLGSDNIAYYQAMFSLHYKDP